LVREHNRKDAIVFEDAGTLVEYLAHHPLVRLRRLLDRTVARGVCHGFFLLVRETALEEVRIEITECSPLPHIEVIGEFGILHVVVVRWIHTYQVNRAVGNCHACRGPAEYADGELSLSEVLAQGCNKTGDTFVRINDLRKSPRDAGVRTGEDHFAKCPFN